MILYKINVWAFFKWNLYYKYLDIELFCVDFSLGRTFFFIILNIFSIQIESVVEIAAGRNSGQSLAITDQKHIMQKFETLHFPEAHPSGRLTGPLRPQVTIAVFAMKLDFLMQPINWKL